MGRLMRSSRRHWSTGLGIACCLRVKWVSHRFPTLCDQELTISRAGGTEEHTCLGLRLRAYLGIPADSFVGALLVNIASSEQHRFTAPHAFCWMLVTLLVQVVGLMPRCAQ